mmetsp:Transcript_42126/g.101316  ORF Transcript_42126/g.101316 Transcript_42126/m.101316 type:complete len:945 (+) Transcript_42126:261-3095(+)
MLEVSAAAAGSSSATTAAPPPVVQATGNHADKEESNSQMQDGSNMAVTNEHHQQQQHLGQQIDDGMERKIPAIEHSSSSSSSSHSSPRSNPSPTSMDSRKRFGDCALVEIIHLHDCLRGAIHALQKDFTDLSLIVFEDIDGTTRIHNSSSSNNNISNISGGESSVDSNSRQQQQQQQLERLVELESRSNARFQVIWSVFRAHSAAEDEFIWPALRSKTKGWTSGSPHSSPKYRPGQDNGNGGDSHSLPNGEESQMTSQPEQHVDSTFTAAAATITTNKPASSSGYDSTASEIVEQEEYEEDHADEERMFTMMDHLLKRLRKGLNVHQSENGRKRSRYSRENVINTMKEIMSLTKTLTQHLFVHLEKEENQCLPLVVKHMTKSEIHDLVGQIMGKRSSDMIAQILTMAVQNLDEADQEGMVKHMKQAMSGTFFDQWLSMAGWMDGGKAKRARAASIGAENDSTPTDGSTPSGMITSDTTNLSQAKRLKPDSSASDSTPAPAAPSTQQQPPTAAVASSMRSVNPSDITPISNVPSEVAGEITSHAELEKLIRAVATNQSLSPKEKQNTIQGLRASVWKRNQRLLTGDYNESTSSHAMAATISGGTVGSATTTTTTTADVQPPAGYYVMGEEEQIFCVEDPNLIPTFSTMELSATYNASTSTGQVFGCPHYARGCKLRHPVSGRLHTCRICCEQKREAAPVVPQDDPEPPLDRYAVKEVMCMECTTLQPANKRCIKPDCTLHTKSEGFARYYCDICHLYDDRQTVNIFHCPYCNTCRLGKGLGIDYRHCMRCNACVAINEEHRCIPQKLQGSCPICHESLFNSTEPMKGIQCGHVMHLSCFNEYRRKQNYSCPLCMRCMEDMSEYFSLLDQAVALQTMPLNLQTTMSNIYCQDCEKTGQCRFHFVGLKCTHCGSYNTREMNRFEAQTSSSSTRSPSPSPPPGTTRQS